MPEGDPNATFSTDVSAMLFIVDDVVRSLGTQVSSRVAVEDLASAGKAALVEALGVPSASQAELASYCRTCVRGAIFDELRRHDPLSRYGRAQVKMLTSAVRDLEAELGRSPDDAEIAEHLGIAQKAVRDIEQLRVAAIAVCTDEEADVAERLLGDLADPNGVSPADAAEVGDGVGIVGDALARLTGKHQAYVMRRYFLEDATLNSIATEIGVTKVRVLQIRDAALVALRSDPGLRSAWEAVLARLVA